MERALLVTIEFDHRARASRPMGDQQMWSPEDEQRELHELAASSGCRIIGEMMVKRHEPVAGTLIGSGKLEELALWIQEHQPNVMIANQELSPAQQRNVEEVVGIKTIDRTQLILDIFAQRAKSQEGKIQVELAQLRYLMPRLVGQGVMLSRLGGGIGTRGPGETKLEVDRRRVRQRISRLQDELKKLARRREATREHRKEGRAFVAALVGYTNAGKTTLLNRLTGAGAQAENRLFTTLDPLARRLRLPDRAGTVNAGEEMSQRAGGATSGEWIILTDTVGFLHRLPHHLIEAFQATLEEARGADLLLHVLDASNPMARQHAQAVHEVLRMLKLERKPIITVLNKADRNSTVDPVSAGLPEPMVISALQGTGLDELLRALQAHKDQPLDSPTAIS